MLDVNTGSLKPSGVGVRLLKLCVTHLCPRVPPQAIRRAQQGEQRGFVEKHREHLDGGKIHARTHARTLVAPPKTVLITKTRVF